MIEFEQIINRAVERCGGLAAVEEELPKPKTAKQLKKLTDAECLSLMSLRIFRAGLKHSVVDAKWPAFEEVFLAFNPEKLQMLSDDDIDVLMQDTRIIRHLGKIKSVRANAQAMMELPEEYNSMSHFIAEWPINDIVGLWDDLKKRFTQLGGMSGPYFLRMVGKDTFLFTKDVVKALNQFDVIDGEPKGKKVIASVQNAFNAWHDETKRPLCALSKILALSVD